MSDVPSTTDQKVALARQIAGVVGGFVDVPAHLKPIAGPVAEAILVKTLEGGSAQDLLEKISRIAEAARVLIAELKD